MQPFASIPTLVHGEEIINVLLNSCFFGEILRAELCRLNIYNTTFRTETTTPNPSPRSRADICELYVVLFVEIGAGTSEPFTRPGDNLQTMIESTQYSAHFPPFSIG